VITIVEEIPIKLKTLEGENAVSISIKIKD